mmetsp:Transcript_29/g.51  ORF Transcript_29/g.51 Transcript_29/m.51 type:complete len:229 (-) Transcript_29:75-761(-)
MRRQAQLCSATVLRQKIVVGCAQLHSRRLLRDCGEPHGLHEGAGLLGLPDRGGQGEPLPSFRFHGGHRRLHRVHLLLRLLRVAPNRARLQSGPDGGDERAVQLHPRVAGFPAGVRWLLRTRDAAGEEVSEAQPGAPGAQNREGKSSQSQAAQQVRPPHRRRAEGEPQRDAREPDPHPEAPLDALHGLVFQSEWNHTPAGVHLAELHFAVPRLQDQALRAPRTQHHEHG